jgi:hypothetical protein
MEQVEIKLKWGGRGVCGRKKYGLQFEKEGMATLR